MPMTFVLTVRLSQRYFDSSVSSTVDAPPATEPFGSNVIGEVELTMRTPSGRSIRRNVPRPSVYS